MINENDIHKYLRHPEYPEYMYEYMRLQSYQNWPIYSLQKPKDLSQAGLFYTGESDHVICFNCGGGLMDFMDDEVPLKIHK
jgi:hypothetical protein